MPQSPATIRPACDQKTNRQSVLFCLPRVTRWLLLIALLFACSDSGLSAKEIAELPPNSWVQLKRDEFGSRRGSTFRYVPEENIFLLWGFMNHDPDMLQEHPLVPIKEYDMVAFSMKTFSWENHFPPAWASRWKKQLPLAYVPRSYSGITSGSERSVLRMPSDRTAASRPDLNMTFNHIAYIPKRRQMFYFVGGLTAVYDVQRRNWFDLLPKDSPPPVYGGSLAYNPLADEVILFGGGNVVEPGPDGRPVGYTGTWVYRFSDGNWHQLELGEQPPARIHTRMVHDAARGTLVLFGGDAQSHYLADTWLFDLKKYQWRKSRAEGCPPPRAGHFTVFDPATGWVIVGGGYNRKDLSDMWAYDAKQDRWQPLSGEVPQGFGIAADIAPKERFILLTASSRAEGDRRSCNALFPVRTTYGYRIEQSSIRADSQARPHAPMPKRPPQANEPTGPPQAERIAAQQQRLTNMPANRWVWLKQPGRRPTVRTWGSATFDTDRGRILYWGGGHCGYGGSDVEMYDPAKHTWKSTSAAPYFFDRIWNLGTNEAGISFAGGPWTTHGRKYFAYDPISQKMILSRDVKLTTGYRPALLKDYAGVPKPRYAALVNPPSSYKKYVTWSLDLESGQWTMLCPAPEGFGTLVTTRHGVVGIDLNYPKRLNDAGYLLPFDKNQLQTETNVYLLDARRKTWQELNSEILDKSERRTVSQPPLCPQNLYEMTALIYDSKRDQLLLHGGGARRNEMWSFSLKSRRWKLLSARVAAPRGDTPPSTLREAVYLPKQDIVLTFGASPETRREIALWAYHVGENAWYRVPVPNLEGLAPSRCTGPTRAMVYDPQRDLVYLVLGESGNLGKTLVHAMRYNHAEAKFYD